MSLISLLDIGKKGISAHQTAMSVAGHNIANLNTPGYSRQVAVLTTSNPINTGVGSIGRGVEVETVQRNYNQFLDDHLAFETSSYGMMDSKSSALQTVELFFSDASGVGLSEDIGNFFNAMHDLANNPGGEAERVALLSRSETMTGSFNSISNNLNEVRKSLDADVRAMTGEINAITSRIAQLNEYIDSTERLGSPANDFRDERTQLVKELSENIDISYYEGEDGRVSIAGKGGFLLVQRDASFDLTTSSNAEGHLDVLSVGAGGSTTNVTTVINGGRLGGMLEARDSDIPGYLGKLDQLAYSIADEINTQHRQGYALDGSGGLGAPIDFFTPMAAVSGAAANMAVDAQVASDTAKIAAALDDGSGFAPGDNRNALAMAEIQRGLTMSGGTTTFEDYYGSIVVDVGTDARRASGQLHQQESLVNQLEMKRESMVGVSLDEELADLVKIQHAFEASARLITVADEMLETIIGLAR